MAVFAVLRRVRMLLLCVLCLPANTWSNKECCWNFSRKTNLPILLHHEGVFKLGCLRFVP